MKNSLKIIIGVAALAIIITAASLGYLTLSSFYKAPSTPYSSSPAAAVSPSGASSSPQALKKKAPDFTVQDFSGKSVSLSDFKGNPVVLNFWASWCPPCKQEMPDYQDMFNQYSSKGVAFLMIDLTDGSRETLAEAKKFLSDSKYTFTAYFDVKLSAATAYSVSSIPASFFIDKDGNITASYIGMIDASTMKKNIEAILK